MGLYTFTDSIIFETARFRFAPGGHSRSRWSSISSFRYVTALSGNFLTSPRYKGGRSKETERVYSRHGHSGFQHCCNDAMQCFRNKNSYNSLVFKQYLARMEDNSLPCNASVVVSEREGTPETKTGSSMFVEDASCLQSTCSYLSKLSMKRNPTPSVDIEEHFKHNKKRTTWTFSCLHRISFKKKLAFAGFLNHQLDPNHDPTHWFRFPSSSSWSELSFRCDLPGLDQVPGKPN